MPMEDGSIDLVGITLKAKLKAVQASCGITALSELDLLLRLEKLYIEGIQEGVAICLKRTEMVLANLDKDHPDG